MVIKENKLRSPTSYWIWLIIFVLHSCTNNGEQTNLKKESVIDKGKKLSLIHCQSCHSYPEPTALPKKVWKRSVLPNMGRRLGMEHHSIMPDYPPIHADLQPNEQQLTQQEWDHLFLYYINKAPDSLHAPVPKTELNALSSSSYSSSTVNTPGNLSRVISYMSSNPQRNELIVGDAKRRRLLFFDDQFNTKNEYQFESPVIGLKRVDHKLYVSTIGKMPPNDEQMGKIIQINTLDQSHKVIIDSLRRPVQTQFHDFNGDNSDEILVCEYGNRNGQLSLFYNNGSKMYEKKILIESPGAIKTIVGDANNDNLDDIFVLFAQGDERIVLLLNKGDTTFEQKTLIRFPPHFGSYDMELADINGNGTKEIIYVNGDNGDLSPVLKPYHGLRIYRQTEPLKFEMAYFFPLYGASKMELIHTGVDKHHDIVLTSTFPAKINPKTPGIVLLENRSNPEDFSFSAYKVPGTLGRSFTVLDGADMDHNGTTEIVAGAMDVQFYLHTNSDSTTGKPNRSIIKIEKH